MPRQLFSGTGSPTVPAAPTEGLPDGRRPSVEISETVEKPFHNKQLTRYNLQLRISSIEIMRCTVPRITFAFALLFLVLASFSVNVQSARGLQDSADQIDPRKRWLDQLAGMENDITSGIFKVKLYCFVDTISREAFQKLLADAKLDDGPAALGKMRAKFPPDTANFWPAKVQIKFAGNRIRNDWTEVDPAFEGTHCFDGKYTIRTQIANNNQTHLQTGRSPIEIFELSTLRVLPKIDKRVGIAGWTLKEHSPIAIRLTDGRYEIEADKNSGIPLRMSIKSEDRATEVYQYRLVNLPGKITIPTITVHARFTADRLNLLSIFVVESHKVNQIVDHDAFRVAVPKGATLVDGRSNPKQPKVNLLENAVHDIASTPWPSIDPP